MLIEADCCLLMLIDADWCWLLLINADWSGLLRDARERTYIPWTSIFMIILIKICKRSACAGSLLPQSWASSSSTRSSSSSSSSWWSSKQALVRSCHRLERLDLEECVLLTDTSISQVCFSFLVFLAENIICGVNRMIGRESDYVTDQLWWWGPIYQFPF